MSNELLSMINFVERDRGVNREVIIQAIESAVLQAARRSPRIPDDVRVFVDRKRYDIREIGRAHV